MENDYRFENANLDKDRYYLDLTLELNDDCYRFFGKEDQDEHYKDYEGINNYEKSNPNLKIQNEFQLFDSTAYKSEKFLYKIKKIKNDLEIEKVSNIEFKSSIKNQEIKHDLKNNDNIQNKHYNEKKEIISIPIKSEPHLENSIINENINKKDLLWIDNSKKILKYHYFKKRKEGKKRYQMKRECMINFGKIILLKK